MTEFCAGCLGEPRAECRDAFAQIGILKVHWECWARCNLSCAFCFRTKDPPVDTAKALQLLAVIKASGAKWVTFAGGDPSLRPDLLTLVRRAQELSLMVEIQTNGDFVSGDFLQSLQMAELVGLSLDASGPVLHDQIRGSSGNFVRVMELAEKLAGHGKQLVIRSVVTRTNYQTLPDLLELLTSLPNLLRWSLLEFSPLGDGRRARTRIGISRGQFIETVRAIESRNGGRLLVDGFTNNLKAKAYALVSPSGRLYGTEEVRSELQHHTAGFMLQDHLSLLSKRLPFSDTVHRQRYSLPRLS